MPMSERIQGDEEAAGRTRDTVYDFIKKQVVRSLGTPGDLLSVQVRPVGGENYRVNVVVGESVGAARIPNSFFLTTDTDGNILSSLPKIMKIY